MGGAALKPAFVLHRRRYRDSSLLLDLYSQTHGRTAVIAKGALSGRGQRAALLQPFVPLLADWRGRGEVQSLAVVEPAGPAIALKGRALYCGFYVNELLARLAPRNDPQLLLFARYGETLAALADAGHDMDRVLRRFELTLLQALGSAADLSLESDGRTPVSADRHYRVDAQGGPHPAPAHDPQAISGATLLALAEEAPLDAAMRQEAKRLLRRILAHHLGDRPLKSRELFKNWQVKTS